VGPEGTLSTRRLVSIAVVLILVAGVLVLLSSTERGTPRRPTSPDRDGSPAEPPVTEGEEKESEAEPTAAIEGTVESAITAKPIDGALVEVTAEGVDGPVGMISPRIASTRSAAGGSFRIDAAPTLRILTVTISARGFHPRRHGVVLRPDAQAPHRIHSRLDPGGVLTGSVYDPDGNPVAGATVYVVPATMVFRFNGGTGRMDYGGYAPAAVTDAEGNYEVIGIPLDGHHHAMAKKPPWVVISIYNRPRFYLDRRDPVRRLDIHLKRYGTVVVHVFGPGGSPVSGARMFNGYTHMGWDPPANVKVDGPGIYRFEHVRPGHLPLYVLAPPFAVAAQNVDVPEGRTTHVSLHLEHGLTAEGVVVDERGEPVAGAEVRAHRQSHLSWSWPPPTHGSQSRALTVADEKGRFVLRGLKSGRHEIEAMAPGHSGARGKALDAPARDLRIVLPRAGTIRFRLEPKVSEARVRWIAARPHHLIRWYGSTTLEEIRTAGADGSFEITGCGTGANDLRILAPGSVVLRPPVTLSPGQVADLGGLRLDPGVELTGQVVGDAGKPLAGATVHTAEDWPAARRSTRTDLDGRFRLSSLPPGPVVIQAHYPGYESKMIKVTSPAVMQLGRPSRDCTVVTVVNSAGVTLPSVRVRFHYPDGQGGFKKHVWLGVYTNSTGQAWWHSGPGKYRAYLVRHPRVFVVVEVKKGETTRYRLVQPD